jgi:hypothetical protein
VRKAAQAASGILFVALSLAFCALVYQQPEKLNAPAWVAYSAAAAFFVAGLMLIVGPARPRTKNWLAVALMVCMVLPGLWIAFGGGERQCKASFLFLQFESEALCRGAFGVGAVVGLGMLALCIANAIHHQRGG